MYSSLKQSLAGPIYTIFTPFSESEALDFDTLASYLKNLYSRGARRFYAMAYNSRYSQMSDDEIFELNGFCSKFLKDLDSDNIVIVGDPIHCSTKQSIEFALHAKDSGADLISLLVREKYFSDEQVLGHFSLVGEAADFPILVHEMPFLSGFDGSQINWPLSLLEALPTIPHIAALKEDAKDPVITKKALELEPDIRVIIAGGGKATLRDYIAYGAQSWLNGISIIDAGIAETFWQACKDNNVAVQDFVIKELEEPFFGTVVKKYGWHRTNKALLQAAGLMHRRDRMPLQHLNDQQFKEVQRVYDGIYKKWMDFLASC